MAAHTITLSRNKFTCSAEKNSELTGDNMILVTVDGSNECDYYTIEYDAEWIQVYKTYNSVSVYINENVSNEARECRVTFTNNMDGEVKTSLTIIQEACNLGFKLGENILYGGLKMGFQLYPSVPTTPKIKGLTAFGGSGKYVIQDILMYHKEEMNGTDVELYEKFDNAFQVYQTEDGLSFINFGRLAIDYEPDYGPYYIVILGHADNLAVKCKIHINFDIQEDVEPKPMSIESNIRMFSLRRSVAPSIPVIIPYQGGCEEIKIQNLNVDNIETLLPKIIDWVTFEYKDGKYYVVLPKHLEPSDRAVEVRLYDKHTNNQLCTLSVYQEGYKEFKIESKTLKFELDKYESTFSIILKVYGGQKQVHCHCNLDWCEINDIETIKTEDTYNVLRYTFTTTENDTILLRQGDIVFTHTNDDTVTSTHEVLQWFEFTDKYKYIIIDEIVCDENEGTKTVEVKTFPYPDSKIRCRMSSRWISCTHEGHEITLTYKKNHLLEERQASLYIYNLDVPQYPVHCIITQKGGHE